MEIIASLHSDPDEGVRRAREGWRFLPVGSEIQLTLQGSLRALRKVVNVRSELAQEAAQEAETN